MMLGLARCFLFLVPTVLILSNLFGLPGILASQGVADLLTSTLAIALGYRLVRTLQTEAYHIQVDERAAATTAAAVETAKA